MEPSDYSSLPDQLWQKVQHALEIITNGIKQYGVNSIALSFNGGKDCTVLLHLLEIALRKLYDNPKPLSLILTLYFQIPDNFPDVLEFMAESKKRHSLNIKECTYSQFNDIVTRDGIKAVFMGTRRTDPHGANLEYFTPTDKGWAPCMRINPLLDWSYHDIWNYLRYLKVPYCILYDKGYTSIGSQTNTFPNPSLKKENGEYAPAYDLENPQEERCGRQNGKI